MAAPEHSPLVIAEVLDDPDTVGQSEYRALHELLVDGTSDLRGPEAAAMAVCMLDEVTAHARAIKERLLPYLYARRAPTG